MDKRINYIIGLDTETCNGIVEGDKLDLSQSLVYDIGWQVTDRKGRVYRQRSFVVAETFFGMREVMQSAYYAEKIPHYIEDIANGTRKVAKFATIRRIFLEDMAEFNCNTVFAHNARFDYNALNNTQRYLSKSQYRYFFPYGTEIWDTLKMCKVISKTPSYRKWCEDNGYMTKHKTPRPRETAEILYRYISGETEFNEAHTGLEDVIIETQIMAHCFRQHKPMTKNLFQRAA